MSGPTVPSPILPNSWQRRGLIAFLAALAPAVFALATNNIWEDFFITVRCSLNLAQGNGLVYEAGRTLHVFTSPLGTLLPAGIAWLLHTTDAQVVLDAFRVVACLALAIAWWLAAPPMKSPTAVAVAAGLWLLDPKFAAFSTNGMETALLILWIVLAWRALSDRRPLVAGVAAGAMMWTRPDGFVFIGALFVATACLDPTTRRDWRGALKLAGIAAALWAPWIAWSWWYYGTPVPHTIVAKSTVVSDVHYARSLLTYPWRLLVGRTAAVDAFLPAYFYFGGWPAAIWLWGKMLSWAAVAAACWPRCAKPARIAGLAFVIGGAYLEFTPRAPWYFPVWETLAYLAAGGVAAALSELVWARRRLWRTLLAVTAVAVLLVQAAFYIAVSIQLREQQSLIEWGLRARLGRDLGASAKPNDTVFLEPLGYIGYFSGLAMRDTPGLCAPEVVALRRAGHKTMGDLALALGPDWVVLRASEYVVIDAATLAEFHRHYRLRGNYDVRQEVEKVEWLPGRDFLLYDAHFLLWQRIASVVPSTGP